MLESLRRPRMALADEPTQPEIDDADAARGDRDDREVRNRIREYLIQAL